MRSHRATLLILGLLLVLLAPLEATKGKVNNKKKAAKKKAAKKKAAKKKKALKKRQTGKKKKTITDELPSPPEYAVGFIQNQPVPACSLWPNNPLGDVLPMDVYFPVDPDNFDPTKVAQVNFVGVKFDLSGFGVAVLDGANVPMADGKFPLIMYGHGYGGFAVENLLTLVELAKSGFVVAAPSHIGSGLIEVRQALEVGGPDAYEQFFESVYFYRPKETQCVTNFMVDNSVFSPGIDSDNIGILGFSTGAISAISASAGYSNIVPIEADPRVKASVGMAPATFGYPVPLYTGKISTPFFLISSEEDESIPPDVVKPFWDLLGGGESAYWMKFATVHHSAFTDICIVKADVDNLDDTDPAKAFVASLLSFYFTGPNPVTCSFIPSTVYAPAITEFFEIHLKGKKYRKSALTKNQYNDAIYDGILEFKKKH